MRRYLRCPGAICCPARRALRAGLQPHIRFCDELIVVDRAEHVAELLGLVGERLGSVLKHRLQHGEHRQGDPRLLASCTFPPPQHRPRRRRRCDSLLPWSHDKPPRAFSRGGTPQGALGGLGTFSLFSLGKGRKSWNFLHYSVWGKRGARGARGAIQSSAVGQGADRVEGCIYRCSSSSPTRSTLRRRSCPEHRSVRTQRATPHPSFLFPRRPALRGN